METDNNHCLTTHLDLLLELGEKTHIQEEATNQIVARRYNTKPNFISKKCHTYKRLIIGRIQLSNV